MDTKSQQAHELLIEGRFYDVTNFRHPGGSIVKFYAGSGDATEAFVEFHYRSPKARKVLKALPSRPAPKDAAAADPIEAARLQRLSAEFSKLRRELETEGWFKPSIPHAVYRCAEIFALFALGAYLVCAFSSVFLQLPGLMLLGIATSRCGWWMHEGGHHSITGYVPMDIRLQEFFMGTGCGMSGAWWRSQHNKHHCAPQKLQHDVDLDTLPLVAFNAKIVEKSKKNAFIKLWIPLQGYLFGPVTCLLVTLFWQLFLHPRHMLRTKRHFEMVCVALRYAIHFGVGRAIGASVPHIILGHVLTMLFGGMYIFTNFALSHTHLPVLDKDRHVHWLEYGADYTIDITPHWFTDWWMGYLNYQIEHHLFPTMPQFRFVKLNARIKKFFDANNLKYDVRDYFAAMGDTLANLHHVGETVNVKG